MNPNKTGDLDSQGIGKLLLRLALPTITAQLVNALYNMVDRIYIGHIPVVGKTALTGVGVCLSLIMIISAFAALTAMGGATRASILLGKGQRDTAERILGNCVTGSVVVGLVLTAVFLSFSRPLLLAFGASEETIVYAVQYMKIYALGTVFVELALGLNAFITAQGFASVAMISVLIGAVANMILDAVLILVFDMGVAGAALATIISQGLSALWVVRFLLGRKTGLRIKKENLRLDWKLYAPCLALGMSPFVMQSTEGVISVCFNASLQKYGGDLAVGAMTILSSVMQFSMLPLQGLTRGAAHHQLQFRRRKCRSGAEDLPAFVAFAVWPIQFLCGLWPCCFRIWWQESSRRTGPSSHTAPGQCGFIWRPRSFLARKSPASRPLLHWATQKCPCFWLSCGRSSC